MYMYFNDNQNNKSKNTHTFLAILNNVDDTWMQQLLKILQSLTFEWTLLQ